VGTPATSCARQGRTQSQQPRLCGWLLCKEAALAGDRCGSEGVKQERSANGQIGRGWSCSSVAVKNHTESWVIQSMAKMWCNACNLSIGAPHRLAHFDMKVPALCCSSSVVMRHNIAVPVNDATWLSGGRWSGTPQLNSACKAQHAPASSTATEVSSSEGRGV
jgi:hypothetical protein